MVTEAFPDTEAVRRTAANLAWVGIQVGKPGPSFAFDRQDISARSGSDDTIDLLDVMKPLEDMSTGLVEYFKKIEKWTKVINLLVDLIVGGIVASIAYSVRDNQFSLIVWSLIIIQALLVIVGFWFFSQGLEASISVVANGIRASGKKVQTWNYRSDKLWLFSKIVFLAYPIRVIELFIFVCGFLVLFTQSADPAALTPVERFAHWGFNLIASVFYGNDNMTPQQRMGAAALNFGATTLGGVILEFVFPTKLKAGSDFASKVMVASWPVGVALFAAGQTWLQAPAAPATVAPQQSITQTAQPAPASLPKASVDAQSASPSPEPMDETSQSEASPSPVASTNIWQPASAEAPPTRYIGGDWSVPGSEQMADLYPPRARDDEVEGTVTIDCAVNTLGKVINCNIISESPVGYGFGEATVNAFIRYAHVNPNSVDGGVKDGDRKKFTYKWVLG